MAEFEELLATLRNPGETAPPETIYDDLGAAYNDRVSASDAKITELSGALETTNSELLKVRAHNYDLLTAVQVGNGPDVRGDLDRVNEPEQVFPTLDDIITYG